jgi:hypothetical protein
MIYYNLRYCHMRNENIQIVASDYYDGFQHLSSIFFMKIHFHYFKHYI